MAIILAIDLGKDNSVFCRLDTSSGEVEFRTAETTPDRAFFAGETGRGC